MTDAQLRDAIIMDYMRLHCHWLSKAIFAKDEKEKREADRLARAAKEKLDYLKRLRDTGKPHGNEG